MTQPRRQTVLLTRTFFGRLFENDLMPPGLPQVQLAIGVIAFLMAPSMLMPVFGSRKYMWLLATPQVLQASLVADRLLATLLSTMVTALITLVIWEGVFPDTRDGRILGVLPIRTRTFVSARLLALLALFLLLVGPPTAISSISFGIVNATFHGFGGFLGCALTHFARTAGSQTVVFFAVIAFQCAVLATFGAAIAQRVAIVLQTVFVGFAFSIPMLFKVPITASLVAAAPLIAPVVGGGALLLYVACYRRMTRLALEGTPRRATHRRAISRLVPAVTRLTAFSPAARGVCAFTLRTLARSRHHRMLFAGWLGIAVALIVSSVLPQILTSGWAAFARPGVAVLAAPLILSALTLVGMRMVFAVPAEIRANWAIRLYEPPLPRHALDGAAAALIAAGVLPSALLAFFSAALLWGATIGLQHAIFCTALGILLAQLLATGLEKMPFTCTYMPGKAKIIKLWPLYLTLFSFYTLSMASLEVTLLRHATMWNGIAVFAGFAATAAIVRWRQAVQVPRLRFQEEDSDTLTLLALYR